MEDLLDKTPDWLNLVYSEICRTKKEEIKFKLAINGIDPDKTFSDENKNNSDNIIVNSRVLSNIGLGKKR